jgi:hypothetical protein
MRNDGKTTNHYLRKLRIELDRLPTDRMYPDVTRYRRIPTGVGRLPNAYDADEASDRRRWIFDRLNF